MPRFHHRIPRKKSNVAQLLTAFITTGLGLTAIIFTFQAANTVQNLFSKASGASRSVVQSWRFAGQGYGWNYICVDYRKQSSSISLYVPNPSCRAQRTMERNFDAAPIVMPVGNKYFTLEASLTKKSASLRQVVLAVVLGESDENLSEFGKLMKKFQDLYKARQSNSSVRKSTVTPSPQSTKSQPSAPTNTPNPEPDSVKIFLSYSLAGRAKPEESLLIALISDGQMKKYEVRFPEVGEIRVTKVQLLLDTVMNGNYDLAIQSIELESATPPPSPTPTPPTPTGSCKRGGCSGELCVDADSDTANRITNCLMRPEYGCYGQYSSCEVQKTTGHCGWTQTNELAACLQNKYITPTPTPTAETIIRTMGEREGSFLIQKISSDSVDGLWYQVYPVARGEGTPKTLHIEDDIGYACEGVSEKLVSIDFSGQRVTFTKSVGQRPIGGCPICLAGNTFIDTPSGLIFVKDLQVGMPIWTATKTGKRIVGVVAKTSKVPVPPTHQMVHLVLDDGRELIVSPGHPTIDGRSVGNLTAGDVYDGNSIISVQRNPYSEGATYDVLPSGETGFYWANGILLGSTLK